jgi:flavin-dependent dehydrogenase
VKEASKNLKFDIIIIGGGITGSATSIFLKNLGYNVAVIEKTDLNKFKQGESLSPECKRFFNLLNFPFNDNIAIEYFANNSNWGSNETLTSDFIFNPYGNGISIDRQLLEHGLISHSQSCGNNILLETSILKIQFLNNNWEISIKNNDKESLIKSRLLIFATGRTSPLNPSSSKRNYLDKLVAVTVVSDIDESSVTHKNLTIEALPNGWFYTNLLPQNKRVLTLFSDSDLLPKSKYDYFKEQLYLTNWYQTQNDTLRETKESVNVFDARTSWSNYQSGNYWLELGDSAYTIDPLSGQGILKNFQMVMFCIDNIEPFFNGEKDINQIYGNFNLNNFSKYQEQQKQVYEMETRWQTNEFWLRRKDNQQKTHS